MIRIKKYYWFVKTFLFKLLFGGVGPLSYIASPNYILGKSKLFIGERVRILYNFRCEIVGAGSVRIGDNTSIGHNCHISACESLTIGKSVTISSNVFVGSLEHCFDRCDVHVMDQSVKCYKTSIGDYSFVGTGAVLLAGSSIGKNCVVGANSVVKGCFPDFSIIAGVPAKAIGSRSSTAI